MRTKGSGWGNGQTKILKVWLIILVALCTITSFAFQSYPIQNCKCKGTLLYGRVKVVESHADFRVKVVDSHPDLEVKRVNYSPTTCGEWRFVDSHPDFTIQYVDSHEDFKIKFR